MTTHPHRYKEFAAGVRDTIPMMIGAAPFGMIFGTLVTSGPLALWHGQFMSLAVFAGSAQFIAVGLIASHASYAVIWATTLIVNLRHVLYGATLAPYVSHLPLRWRLALGAVLVDEVFAVAWAHYRRHPPGDDVSPWHFLGSGLSMYLNWQLWTAAGLVFGAAFPGLQTLGLDFAMVVTFIAIVVPQLVALRFLAAAVTSGVLAFYWQAWPYKLGLLGAVLAGVAVGVALSLPRKPRRNPDADAQSRAQNQTGEPRQARAPRDAHAVAGGSQ